MPSDQNPEHDFLSNMRPKTKEKPRKQCQLPFKRQGNGGCNSRVSNNSATKNAKNSPLLHVYDLENAFKVNFVVYSIHNLHIILGRLLYTNFNFLTRKYDHLYLDLGKLCRIMKVLKSLKCIKSVHFEKLNFNFKHSQRFKVSPR